jgi:hypothetical protein
MIEFLPAGGLKKCIAILATTESKHGNFRLADHTPRMPSRDVLAGLLKGVDKLEGFFGRGVVERDDQAVFGVD